jgi:hypothetical protein
MKCININQWTHVDLLGYVLEVFYSLSMTSSGFMPKYRFKNKYLFNNDIDFTEYVT